MCRAKCAWGCRSDSIQRETVPPLLCALRGRVGFEGHITFFFSLCGKEEQHTETYPPQKPSHQIITAKQQTTTNNTNTCTHTHTATPRPSPCPFPRPSSQKPKELESRKQIERGSTAFVLLQKTNRPATMPLQPL